MRRHLTNPLRRWRVPIWASQAGGDGNGNGDDQPPFGVPPSEEGRSGNLGPPPPVFREVGGSGGGSDPPPPYQIGDAAAARQPPRRWWTRILIIVAGLLVLFVLANIGVNLYVDRLWFDELGYRAVFNTRIGTQVWLFFAAFGIAFAFLLANLAIAWRLPLEADSPASSPFRELSFESVRRSALIGAAVSALFLAIIFGSLASGRWDEILQFIHAEPFGVRDAQFDRDAGFYVFKLEALQFIKGWVVGLGIVSLLAVSAVYVFRVMLHGGTAAATTPVRVHLAILIALIMALFAWGYWLARFELVVSENGIVFGATYTDANVRDGAQWVMVFIGLIVAAAVLTWPLHRRLIVPGGAIGVLVLTSIGGTLIYPAMVQRFTVQPNELAREEQFIERNISATRVAFGLDRIEEREFPANETVSQQDVEQNPEALRNVRLWDHRPLNDTLNTIQTIRPLYLFPDVDVDRYFIGGEERQVFLSARELSHSNLQPNQQSWVNRRLQFTHGFGVTISPVDEVTAAGEPPFWVSNIPPEVTLPAGSEEIAISQPRIYFGEATGSYVIANSKDEEFDFPRTEAASADEDGEIAPSEQALNRYDGSGGIRLGSFLRRLAFAWSFSDTNILISGSLSAESRILFRRNIQERVNELAPFLILDADPYIVVGEDGRLFWIQDAYTTSNRFPYAQPHVSGVNYIRNSVKAVIDAYNGTVDLFIVDDSDPVIRVWANIFPDLFRPASEFRDDLRRHWRYPQDLFQVQSDQYLTYHIASPRTLFNREDIWAIPQEVLREQQIPVEPYYVTLRLPDQEESEFLLILPFTPRNRTNAIAWLAGRSDGENYGRLFAFRFPRNKNVDGPAQIEARIDQDVAISRQFTLLGQRGSSVIRGNLLFIPVGDSYVYVEPLYLQAENARFPQLKGVIVVNGNTIALEDTFSRAAAVALGRSPPRGLSALGDVPGEAAPPAAETPAADAPQDEDDAQDEDSEAPAAPPGGAADDDLRGLIVEAQEIFDDAQDRLADGDFAGYGAALDRLEAVLQRLEAATRDGAQ